MAPELGEPNALASGPGAKNAEEPRPAASAVGSQDRQLWVHWDNALVRHAFSVSPVSLSEAPSLQTGLGLLPIPEQSQFVPNVRPVPTVLRPCIHSDIKQTLMAARATTSLITECASSEPRQVAGSPSKYRKISSPNALPQEAPQTISMHLSLPLKRSTAFVVWLLAGLAFVAAWTKPVHGAVITFTDRATFTGALGTRTFVATEDFSNNPAGLTSIPVNTQFDVGAFDVFYTTANNQDQPATSLSNQGAVQRLDLQFDRGDGGGGVFSTQTGRVTTAIEFRFDDELFGFGGDFGDLLNPTGTFSSQNGNQLTLTVNGDSINIDDLLVDSGGMNDTENGFVGFLSDTPFTSITLTGTPVNVVDTFGFDNAILVGPPVPEPSTLLVTAVFGIGFLQRRRRRNKAATAAEAPPPD